ncbi:hypothetical protein HYS92_03340 [Candidatus Daviesbacteria bacterium]|nr:hypothetical protein [Candidatus Daviesbacteria bacterium]
MKYFYQKYIVIESLVGKLHEMNLSDEERLHLATLIDSTLHHAILDEILSNLATEDKRLFLKRLEDDPSSEKMMEFLKEKIEGIEEKIKKVSDDLIQEMHEDIKKAKRIKNKE